MPGVASQLEVKIQTLSGPDQRAIHIVPVRPHVQSQLSSARHRVIACFLYGP